MQINQYKESSVAREEKAVASNIKRVLIAIIASMCCVAIFFINQTFAHGSVETPISRIYQCYLEGPENPQSDACQAAVDVGGTQALYDWNGVNRLADGDHQAIIPDGELCSAGNEEFKGLDLARDDWVTQTITSDANGNYEFIYYATAPHSTDYFHFYVTKDNYDPLQPLKWSDLEDTPFCIVNDVTLENGRYHMTCPLPQNKTGIHVIYTIWQRDDSPEAFYACSDVQFDDDTPQEPEAPEVAITTVDNNIDLSWPHALPNGAYDIHRHTQPYYATSLATILNSLYQPFDEVVTFSDEESAVGDVAINHFYYVSSKNSVDDTALSNHVGEFDFAIIPGS